MDLSVYSNFAKEIDFSPRLFPVSGKNRALDSGKGLPQCKMVFDDESVERLVYGEPGPGPTSANIYQEVRGNIQAMEQLAKDGDFAGALHALKRLARDKQPLSMRACRDLIELLAHFIPQIPCPLLEHDLRGLEVLLERICDLLEEQRIPGMLEDARTYLFRCYEHTGAFESARRILGRMIEAENKNNVALAIHLNNLGFEYLLEKRWEEGLPYFEQAASLAFEAGDLLEFAVMKSNYWTCRIEAEGVNSSSKAEAEISRFRDILKSAGDWRERKPLILLARIEENRRNLELAVRYAKRAVEVARNSRTLWPEMDGAYLKKLRSNW